jgi:hypothetical protein
LNSGWDGFDEKSYNICRIIRDNWSKKISSLIFIAPSAIIKGENNTLINPNHPEFLKGRIINSEPFLFDTQK